MAFIKNTLRSRSTSRGSLQDEWINEDPGPSRGTEEVGRSDSEIWRTSYEPKDAQEDDNYSCTTKDPLGQLLLGISQSFNALRQQVGGSGVPEIPIEEVCRQFADKVDLETKNEEDVIQKTAKLAESNMVEASMAYQVVMPKLRAPTHFSPTDTLAKTSNWKEALALFPKQRFSGEDKSQSIVEFLRTCNQSQKVLNLSRSDFALMMTRSMTGAAWNQTSAFFDSGESIETVYQKLLTMYDNSPSPEESKEMLVRVRAQKSDTLQTLTAKILELATNAARLAGERGNTQQIVDMTGCRALIDALPQTNDFNSPRARAQLIYHELYAKLGEMPTFMKFAARLNAHAGEMNMLIRLHGESAHRGMPAKRKPYQRYSYMSSRDTRERNSKLARINNVNQNMSRTSSGGEKRALNHERGAPGTSQGIPQGTARMGKYCSLCGGTNHNATDICYKIRHNGRAILVMPSQKPCGLCEKIDQVKLYHPEKNCWHRDRPNSVGNTESGHSRKHRSHLQHRQRPSGGLRGRDRRERKSS